MHKKNFDDNYKIIIDSLENIAVSVNEYRQEYNFKISKHRAENPKIAKMIFDNIANGYSVSESLVISALAFNTDLQRTRAVYTAHKNATRAANAYAKNYLIHVLRKRGFKIDDIAIILGCTKQTVYNYTKRPCFI